MKESNRVTQSVRDLETVKEWVKFFANEEDRPEVRDMIRKLDKAKDLLVELSIDQKKQNARLWKFWTMFKR